MEPSHLSVSDDDVLSRLLLSDVAAAADAAAAAAVAAATAAAVAIAVAAAVAAAVAVELMLLQPVAATDGNIDDDDDDALCGAFGAVGSVAAAADAAVATTAPVTAAATAPLAAVATFRFDADEEHALLPDVCRSADDCDQCEEARDSISLSSRSLCGVKENE